ncbi:NUDIX hydrolase [Planktothrix tepida]|uniref:NUDIX hydrolase n=2 Tax=Planktothrix TaxID=54304 RepID=A0A1J1LHX3_9CYAN|nr:MULTISPECIES: NUDIX hydrolase [Planktothrix]CAD5910780.1 NUDIX hydrolase [Planktothrix tepida]CAD5911847.1 NUDIX hydrolase [Planktothrix pseudagardhii]CUR32104.1 NUDIX hydrolase [Planktothrix tepida PCC 9214]
MIQVSLAILYREGKFLFQLRDNIPGIIHPGVWGLFGGHLEGEETPELCLKRELIEEIGYQVSDLVLFKEYGDSLVNRFVFYAPLTVDLSQLVLNEGWDMGLLTTENIKAGECYSHKAGMVRLIGTPHQRILLDFITQKLI